MQDRLQISQETKKSNYVKEKRRKGQIELGTLIL